MCITSHAIMIWAAGEMGGAEFLENCKEITVHARGSKYVL